MGVACSYSLAHVFVFSSSSFFFFLIILLIYTKADTYVFQDFSNKEVHLQTHTRDMHYSSLDWCLLLTEMMGSVSRHCSAQLQNQISKHRE